MPIATTVKMPLTLEDHAQAINVPVPSSHPHHSGENSLREPISILSRSEKIEHTGIAVCGSGHSSTWSWR